MKQEGVHKYKPYIIGISGGSGSGKTTFVNRLKAHFEEDEFCVFSQDDYYRPREEQQHDENNEQNFDLPTSIDREAYHQHLRELLAGNSVNRMEYSYNNQLAKPKMKTFHPAKVILLEGIFVFYYKEIFDYIDLRIFIDSKDSIKVIRRIKRDRTERNYPLEDVLYRYEHHVTPTYEQYIYPFREKAHLVINNNSGFDEALGILVSGIKAKISR